MRCPKCKHVNNPSDTECASCGLLFKDLKREEKTASTGGQLCTWNDHGMSCPYRAVFFFGKPLCREHMDAYQGLEPKGRGNYPVQSERSLVMRQWDGFQRKAYDGGTFRPALEWAEGERYGEFRERVREHVSNKLLDQIQE